MNSYIAQHGLAGGETGQGKLEPVKARLRGAPSAAMLP